jgi:hypothetical protein
MKVYDIIAKWECAIQYRTLADLTPFNLAHTSLNYKKYIIRKRRK